MKAHTPPKFTAWEKLLIMLGMVFFFYGLLTAMADVRAWLYPPEVCKRVTIKIVEPHYHLKEVEV